MSSTRVHTIHCDGCGDWWESSAVVEGTAAQARGKLTGTGWRLGLRGSYPGLVADYCPACVADGTAPTATEASCAECRSLRLHGQTPAECLEHRREEGHS